MRWIDLARSFQYMEWHNSGIPTLKHTICVPNVFLKIAVKPNNYQFYLPPTSSNFVTVSHINSWDQVNSWRNFWNLWNCPPCRNKSGSSLLLNVTVYWQSSNTEAYAKKLCQIVANNIDNVGRGCGLRIYVRNFRCS